jgi:hypothetical protein
MSRFLSILLFIFLSGCAVPEHYAVKSSNGVDIILYLPDVEKVYFASSLDGFKEHDLKKEPNDIWVMSRVKGSESFKYFYIIDGELFLPPCRYMEDDDFGNRNCIYQP